MACLEHNIVSITKMSMVLSHLFVRDDLQRERHSFFAFEPQTPVTHANEWI